MVGHSRLLSVVGCLKAHCYSGDPQVSLRRISPEPIQLQLSNNPPTTSANMEPLLQRLHPEVLHDIAQILDHTHPPSLVHFALASKGCYAIASRFLHRTIKLAVTNGERLVSDAKKWEAILDRDCGFAHVRRLILVPPTDDVLNYLSLEPCERHDNDGLDLQSCWDLCNTYGCWSAESFIHLFSDEDWQSLSRLVGRLTGLSDMFWACLIQIPLCVLEVLHDSLRRCRLHNYNLSCSDETTENAIATYDRAVATSPCLYGIGNLHLDKKHCALALVKRLMPPRLKMVHYLLNCDITELQEAVPNMSQPVPLELAQLHDVWHRNIPFDIVDRLVCGNFSALRALKLNMCLAPEGLPEPSSFPSLTTLFFTYNYEDTELPLEYRDWVINFIRNLPRLTALGVQNWNRAVSITPALGPNLHTLNLSTGRVAGGAPLRDDHILQLAHLCPLIEKLALEVKRSRGDAAEVRRYRALGRLSRLQHLELTLDASPPGLITTTTPADNLQLARETAIEPWFDEQDSQLLKERLAPHREGHVRDSLINSAVDAALTRAIFEVIDRAKPYGLQPNVLRLERLELCASGGMAFPHRAMAVFPGIGLRRFFAALRCSWVAERDVRDDARDVVHVRETHVGQRQRALKFHNVQKAREHKAREQRYYEYLFGLWRRVWPVEHEGRDWWDDWQSYPLELGEDAEM